jgi:hypothetical protein
MYDPADEKVDALFGALTTLLQGLQPALVKKLLSRLFEEMALHEILAERAAGRPLSAEAVEEGLAEHWERVEELRNDKAAAFLHSIQMEEF